MSSETKNVPELRFPEFEGEWVATGLGVAFEINPKTQQLPNEFFYIDLESVSDGKLTNPEKVALFNAPSRAQRYLENDDLLFQLVRPYQKNNLYFKLGSGYVASTGYAQIRAGELSRFLYQFLHNDNFVRTVLSRSTGTSYPAITSNDLAKITVSYPSHTIEQQKIANFLGRVDERIKATEREKELLEQYKTGLMQKLFLQQIRFKDDNGNDYPDWGICSLIEATDNDKENSFTDGDWIESPYITKQGNRLIQTGNIGVGHFRNGTKRYISDKSFEELNCKEVRTGDLLICRLAEPAGRACIVPDINETRMLTSVDVTIVKLNASKVIGEFLVFYLSLPQTLYHISTLCGGSTRSRVARSNLAKVKFPLPSYDEQSKIANTLLAMDNKIDAVAKSLEELKQFKKGLLQKMFV